MTSLDIGAAAEANMLTHMSWLQRRIDGMQVLADEQLTLIDSGLPSDSFNVVCRARLEPDSAADRIIGVLAHFRSAARPFSWWVGPEDRPADLGHKLIRAGFRAAEGDVAMAADLDSMRACGDTLRGLRIERASTAAHVGQFATILAASWSPPDAGVLRFYELAAPLLLQADSPIRLYVGYQDNVPVASAEITTSASVAGVYNVSTISAERRRGIGTAMMQRALQDARAEGFRTAILQSSREGVGLYARIGFEAVGEFVEYKVDTALQKPEAT